MAKKKSNLDLEIDHVLEILGRMSPDSESYSDAVKNLEILMKANSEKAKPALDINTVITAGASILGIVVIISYEHLHPVVSKAINFVLKGRV